MITNKFSWVALTAAGFLAVACGGKTTLTGSRSAAGESSAPAPEAPAAEAPGVGYGQPSTASAPQSAPPSEAKASASGAPSDFDGRDRAAEAEERPGLGTT